MPESQKLLRRFALACLLLLCVTAMLCGAALVDNNTRFLSLGEPGRQVGFALDRQTTTLRWDGQALALPPLAPSVQWLRLLPAPFGSLVMLGETVKNICAGD
ncbi:MAG: hypothetical protein FWE98_06760 [Oscillospiraceae bacterium]|nr:hypothetical protein [Oscillospiraceae bacterium]